MWLKELNRLAHLLGIRGVPVYGVQDERAGQVHLARDE